MLRNTRGKNAARNFLVNMVIDLSFLAHLFRERTDFPLLQSSCQSSRPRPLEAPPLRFPLLSSVALRGGQQDGGASAGPRSERRRPPGSFHVAGVLRGVWEAIAGALWTRLLPWIPAGMSEAKKPLCALYGNTLAPESRVVMGDAHAANGEHEDLLPRLLWTFQEALGELDVCPLKLGGHNNLCMSHTLTAKSKPSWSCSYKKRNNSPIKRETTLR